MSFREEWHARFAVRITQHPSLSCKEIKKRPKARPAFRQRRFADEETFSDFTDFTERKGPDRLQAARPRMGGNPV
ncbi:hypothetical protein HMPREF3039_00229 [Akkermansia sp. KLE1798]|nr:hypothetical protein HMPREF3039_00229 [Akkermansia sp. KLE1798]KZA03554.1 hypothetical protein HMPREF1326_02786 [Akkermansia sp. KLE1605]